MSCRALVDAPLGTSTQREPLTAVLVNDAGAAPAGCDGSSANVTSTAASPVRTAVRPLMRGVIDPPGRGEVPDGPDVERDSFVYPSQPIDIRQLRSAPDMNPRT